MQHEIVALAREAGFNEVSLEDIVELLDSHGENLSNEDLVELSQNSVTNQVSVETDSDSEIQKKLTNKGMLEAFTLIESRMTILNEDDPNMERNMKCNRLIEEGIYPYKEIYNENRKKATQMILHSFFDITAKETQITGMSIENEINNALY
ncbi:hypothetical protein HELRODRAFT_164948 [Helobdella robusta]|uniref:Uncharacterized protein n=1 Tax=Helobdella robusta TaxID=6412 RepID=T1EW02_HELRO|nr:hypothetical protein HELRODRAFT_164948 [Helobdella robusta]ESN92822.1 hypothetical protein HELRODRAFT_164948 [Helobdella robusta]